MTTSRYDGFIIWGHGLPYINEIMSILRSRFKIIVILRKEIDDMRAFVDEVYSTDTYPIGMIQEKTEYLLSEKNEAVLILVKNDNVDTWDVEMGKYAKTECRYIAETKVIIRQKWNKQPHHHVVHGTDNESQANHLTRMFSGNPIEYYLVNEGTPFPFHIEPFEYEEVEIDIMEVEGKILGDIWDRKMIGTPQYLYVAGNRQPYIDYHEEHYGIGLVEDHFPEQFDDMIKYYDEGGTFPPVLVIGDRIIDGGHRCAIYLARGVLKTKALRMKKECRAKFFKKRVILLGGTGVIGQSLMGAFDQDKYEVVALGSKDVDVTDPHAEWTRLDGAAIVVNLAGIMAPTPLSEHSGMSQKMVEVNCMGAVNFLMGVLPLLQPHRYGRIIMISSILSEVVVPGYGVYSATKAFVDRLVKNASIENIKLDITVNSIQLGYTGIGQTPKMIKKTEAKIGTGRVVSPREIAMTIEYLIENPYITGQNIRLDGGLL